MSSPAPSPSPTPPAGYKPGVAMPFIPPPPANTDAESHYDSIMQTTVLSIVPSGNRLSMRISSTAITSIGDLFAVTGGLVTYIPAGAPLPLPGTPPPTSPGAGSLVLQTWISDVNELKKILPGGVPAESHALYLNVTDTSVRAALTPMVQALAEKVLKGAWNQPSPPGGRADLEKNYLDRVLLGQVTVFVRPGDKIGEAAAPDPSINADHECTLVFKSNAGNELSPVLQLRGMPSYADDKWEHHPIAVALESVVVPVTMNLQFEVWNTTTKAFEKLPAGIAVDVLDYDPLSPNDLLDTQHTDSQGRVQFNFSRLDPVAGDQPDIFFLVHTNGASHAGLTLPEEWSTKGWKAVDGSPGYYEDFAGTQLGEPNQPLVFRIGVDFHLKLEYKHGLTGFFDPAPKGVPIEINTDPGGLPKMLTHTDEKGEVHDVLFDIEGEDDLFFHVDFEMQDDPSIHLRRTRVQMDPSGWNTFWDDADRTPDSYHPDLDHTSIGTQTTPAKLTCTVNERNVALYFLKIVREWSTFFFLITDGAWWSVEDLVIFRDIIPPATLSFSWPVQNVHIHPSAHWDRDTIVHELTHQVVWQQADYSTLGIAVEARLIGHWSFFGELSLYHNDDLLLNNEQAFIEGWPEFIAGIFSGTSAPCSPTIKTSPLRTDRNTSAGTLGPPPNNRGESVEGAFANGLWTVFQQHVVQDPSGFNVQVTESINGDITRQPFLMNPGVRSRFLSMIWQPLNALAPLNNPTTTDYIARIQAGNTADWPAIQATLQKFNMAF